MVVPGSGLTQSKANCFIHTENKGGDTARYLVGQIYRQSSQGRDNPPKCLSAFNTAGTPFALGHVMALELGGCDVSANIVPQYGQWQGNPRGAWRAMEIAIYDAAADADVMLVEIIYGTGAFAVTADKQQEAFADGDKLFHWQEARIPVRFRVWTVGLAWKSGTVSIKDYLDADDAGKDAKVAALFAAMSGTGVVKRFDEEINAMPQIDRDYWRLQMINNYVRESHRTYTTKTDRHNKTAQANYQILLSKWQKDNPGARAPSRRLSVKQPVGMGAPKPPAEVVSLELARWVAEEETVKTLHAQLISKQSPPGAVKGWTDVEMNLLTPQSISAAIFQK